MNKIIIYSKCQYSLVALNHIVQKETRLKREGRIYVPDSYHNIQEITPFSLNRARTTTIFFRVDMQSGKCIRALYESIAASGNKLHIRIIILGTTTPGKIICNYLERQGICSRFIDIQTPVKSIQRAIKRELQAEMNVPETQSQAALTKREIEVMARVLLGESPYRIGRRLGIDRKAVYAHRAHAMQKMGCGSSRQGHLLLREWI